IDYSLPKIVPGTYAIYNFGRFIDDFHAYDSFGHDMVVSHPDENNWTIENATGLYRITYKVNDSYDDWGQKDKAVFEPAGSNIQADTNFVVNTFAFIGYFQNHEEQPYDIHIHHSENFYGSTALIDQDNSKIDDQFVETNYHDVANNPLMYNMPDTATLQVA